MFNMWPLRLTHTKIGWRGKTSRP